MTQQTKKILFNSLQTAKHKVNESITPSLFPTTDELNDTEYWTFSDLYNIFGTSYVGNHVDLPMNVTQESSMFSDFYSLPKSLTADGSVPNNFYNFCNNHVVSIRNNYTINDTAILKHNGPDARLTRYASWALIRKWPNRIFSQLYFMMPDITFEKLYNASYKFGRLYQRQKLANADRIVNGIAHKNHADLRSFNSAMHKAFFYSTPLDKIKSAYNISGTIFDYLGIQSLRARRMALGRAIQRYNSGSQINFDTFTKIVYSELVNERVRMLQHTGRAPEQDISRESVQNIASQLKKMERAFINKYASQSLR